MKKKDFKRYQTTYRTVRAGSGGFKMRRQDKVIHSRRHTAMGKSNTERSETEAVSTNYTGYTKMNLVNNIP